MQRGRARDDFFDIGDPFASFGGFGCSRNLMSSFFGRDPFDDPFFTRPFGSTFGPSMFGTSMFGAGGSPFGDSMNSGFLENQPPQTRASKGPVIEELSSNEEEDPIDKEKPAKHSRSSNEPYVQDPDDGQEENGRCVQYISDYNRAHRAQPQTRSYSFHSSTVTYGGANGAYYTASTTRRKGGNGVTVEESKEADTTTGKAAHRISRGIRDKGHSVTRKLKSDGKVDTIQTLHNLNEDDLAGFEENWRGNARKHLPGWNGDFDMLQNGHTGSSSGQGARGLALPSTEPPRNAEVSRLKQPARPRSGGKHTYNERA